MHQVFARSAAFALLATLAACQSAPPPPPPVVAEPEPLTWGRRDCQRAAGNQSIQDAFVRDKAYCMQVGNVAEDGTVNNAMVDCMSRRGYAYSTRSGHDAFCARTTRR